MEQSLVISRQSGDANRGRAAFEPATGSNKSRRFVRHEVGKTFRGKRFKVNVIYSLLIASIFFTILSAVATCTHLPANDKDVLSQASTRFNIFRLISFTLLAVTCVLALVTIVRKDKHNGRLLAKLKSANRDLESEVQKRTNELAEAIKAKDHFLAIATHDLKAPISGILGLVELVKIENKNRSANESEYLSHMEYSCRKMQGLISDILEINRIEQGQGKVDRQRLDVLPMLRKLRFDFAHQAAKKNIDLIFIEDIDTTIETDPESLSRILENLLSNAIKFSPPMKKVSMRAFSANDSVIFEVSDEGPGIPVEEQPKLFNKFQRLSNRPTNSETSTGLGLSIVKQLTTQLGGEVAFRTEVGKGTTFLVTFPA